MSEKSSLKSRRLLMSNFKLNVLLEVTLSINENLPVKELLNKYQRILKDDLEIGKVIVYKLNENWECILNAGFDKKHENLDVIKYLTDITDISPINAVSQKFSDDVDIIIPVNHHDKPIAYVLIGDIDEESEGVSPIIKHLRFIQTLSNIIVVAIENIRLYNESLQQVAMKKELELASRMQTMLIPDKSSLPSNNHVHLCAFYHPHFEVGGDYYDLIELSENEIGFCIADVSGKGISAAILMSNFQANLRALFTKSIELEELVSKLNEKVMNSANGEKFITLFIGKYDYLTRNLEFINAGHNPPLLFDKKSNQLSLLKSGCVGMGMLDEIPVINKENIQIGNPTKILCYTDGLVELIEDEEVGFGTSFIEKEISNQESIKTNIAEIIKKQNIIEGSAAIFDDISILGIDFSGH
jgi:sigma-B regulation protein RsbU (phosphoserine phosphatase)